MSSEVNKMIVTAAGDSLNNHYSRTFMMHAFKNATRMDEYDSPAGLPAGWKRRCVMRKSGASAGQFDVYYYSPDGKRFRSRKEIARYLEKIGGPLDIKAFDFRRAELSRDPTRRKERSEPFITQKAVLSKMMRVSGTEMAGPIQVTRIRSEDPIKMPVVVTVPLDTNGSNNNMSISHSVEGSSAAKTQNGTSSSLGNIVNKLWKRKLSSSDTTSAVKRVPPLPAVAQTKSEAAETVIVSHNSTTHMSASGSVTSPVTTTSRMSLSPPGTPTANLALLQNMKLLAAWRQLQQSTAPFVPVATAIPTTHNAKVSVTPTYSRSSLGQQCPLLSPVMGVRQGCFSPMFVPFFATSNQMKPVLTTSNQMKPVFITPPGTPVSMTNFGSSMPNAGINVPLKPILASVSLSPK